MSNQSSFGTGTAISDREVSGYETDDEDEKEKEALNSCSKIAAKIRTQLEEFNPISSLSLSCTVNKGQIMVDNLHVQWKTKMKPDLPNVVNENIQAETLLLDPLPTLNSDLNTYIGHKT